MDKTHYERRSHEQGNYEITPKYKDQVVVTIKSLATGQTMKVYLDEPTQSTGKEINYTDYTGHFYEEEFMVTLSEGYEITGLPLMYPYWNGKGGNNAVIDEENYSVIFRDNNMTVTINLLSSPIRIVLEDSQDQTENVVKYIFTPFGIGYDDTTSPTIPPGEVVVNPGEGKEKITT